MMSRRALSILPLLVAMAGCAPQGTVTRHLLPQPASVDSPSAQVSSRAVGLAVTQPLMSATEVQPPRPVAVLLPTSGTHAEAARVIRAGLLQAWRRDAAAGLPEPEFFDTTVHGAPAAYAAAIAAGAGRVIGPLLKEDIVRLVREAPQGPPILALNRVEESRDGLFQFALVPEEELEQLLERAHQEGHLRALVLVAGTPLGQRMFQFFSTTWPQQGGRLVHVEIQLPDESNLAPLVQRLAQASADADALFLLGVEERMASLLVPGVRAAASGRPLTVYATSHLLSGPAVFDPVLAEVILCDSPALRRGVTDALEAGISPRLFAFGEDAWRLAQRLEEWRVNPDAVLDGGSGVLRPGASGRVKRRLACDRLGAPPRSEPTHP